MSRNTLLVAAILVALGLGGGLLGLALAATTPTWLISRDRAVLKVAKRAARLGLPILSPAAWLKLNAPG